MAQPQISARTSRKMRLLRGKALRLFDDSVRDMELAITDRGIARSRELASKGLKGLLPCSVVILLSCLPTRNLWLIVIGALFVLGALLFILYHRTEAKALTKFREQLEKKKAIREVLRA